MSILRRTLIFAVAALPSIAFGGPVRALETDAAWRHVDGTIEAILALIVANRPRDQIAAELTRIIEQRTALPQLARFTVGPSWRSMTEAQRARFTDTFARYISFIYAGHFRRFEGTVEDLRAAVHILRAEDAGAKGILVHSEIRPTGKTPISIDWLVSDRSGKVAVSDVVVEGISMAVTQREIIGAMLEARHGDIDRLIADLEAERTGQRP